MTVKNEQMMGIDIHPLEQKSVARLPFPDGDDRGFRPNGLEKVESHRTDTAPQFNGGGEYQLPQLDGCLNGAAPHKFILPRYIALFT